MRFSERTDLGLERYYDFMYASLKNGLWNAVCIHFRLGAPKVFPDARDAELFMSIFEFFGDKFDKMPFGFQECVRALRSEFFSLEWYEVFDFIEFLAEKNGNIERKVNQTLEMDQFPYRMADGKFMPSGAVKPPVGGTAPHPLAREEKYQ
jgi:hypothetical protein